MKKTYFSIFILFSALLSCSKSGFLDNKAVSLSEETVFSDSLRTRNFLFRIYSDVGFSFTKGRWSSHGNTEQATDDAEYAYSGTTQLAVVLYNGSVSPSTFPFTEFWSLPWTNIRRVNLLLSKLPTTPLAASTRSLYEGEARFLRAYYYHHLLTTFGGIPLIGDKVFGLEDVINLPRNNFEECIAYVSKELDEAAALLPPPGTGGYEEQDYGRVTKGACLALKSRVLLYAASPLFNGGSISTDAALAKLVSYPTYDVKHWQDAANAAAAVINANYYSLHQGATATPGFGFFDVFLKRVNNEYIFAFHRPLNRDMEVFYNPPSRGGQKNSQPTQNLVDAFPMKNGKAITDPTSGYNPNNPYVNRDPRFEYSIIYNNSLYYSTSTNSKIAVSTYLDAATDGYKATGDGPTTTGYYVRKMCDDNISANSSFNTERGWPLMRYAEVLLNYAEAINETGQTQLAYPKLIELRKRAGIDAGADGNYGLKANMTVTEMRDIIQNERRIELAFEDQRWHDIRRWKIAMTVNNGFNKAMRIVRTVTNNVTTYTYTVVPTIRRHNFRPEMYLLPIPLSEVLKAPAMLQNPGW
jgi:hypothetical protein